MQIPTVILIWIILFRFVFSGSDFESCNKITSSSKDSYGIHQYFEDNKSKATSTNISSVLFTKLNDKSSVLKKIVLSNPKFAASTSREIEILGKVQNNPCFVQLVNCYYYPDLKVIYIHTDRLDGDFSDQADIWTSFKKKSDFRSRMDVYTGMIECLNELHKLNILHNDIKPKNIVALSDKPKALNFIDFGLSTIGEFGHQPGGTDHFLPPEYAQASNNDDGSYTCQISEYTDGSRDIYALGVTYAILEFGLNSVLKGIDRAKAVNLGKCFLINEVQSIIENNIKELCSKVLKNRADERRSFVYMIEAMVTEPSSNRPSAKFAQNTLITMYETQYGEYVRINKPKYLDITSLFRNFFII